MPPDDLKRESLFSGLRKGGRRGDDHAPATAEILVLDHVLPRMLADGNHYYVRADGTEREFNWRWSLPWPALSKTFLRAIHEMSQVGGPIATEKSAQAYQSWVKPLFVWLAEVDPEREIGSKGAPFAPEVFERWKIHLDERVAAKDIRSKTAYGYKGAVARVVEHVIKRRPGELSAGWRKSDLHHDDFENDNEARQPYSISEALRITREAARILLNLQRPEGRTLAQGPLEQLAIYTLVGLKLGIETECIDRLRLCDLLPTEDGKRLRIRYTKRRVQGHPRNRAKSVSLEEWGEALEEVGSFRSVGGVLAYACRQARARGVAEDGSLWLRPYVAPDFASFTNHLYDRGLRADDGGLLRIDRTRFRVTYKTTRMLKSGGQLALVADDHSKAVGSKHYLENERLQPFYEQAVVDAQMEALAYALRAPKIVELPDDASDEDVAAAAKRIGETPEEVRRALNGETDVWLANCKNFYKSPFDPAGTPCSKAFWACFGCENALVTRRTLPRVMRFLSHLVGQRRLLPTAEWEQKFGQPYRQITEHILPRFPQEVIGEARAIAEGIEGALHLPPELQVA